MKTGNPFFLKIQSGINLGTNFFIRLRIKHRRQIKEKFVI